MHKTIIFVAVLFIMIFAVTVAGANTMSPVTGTVAQNGHTVSGAQVTVQCLAPATHRLYTTSQPDGYYSILVPVTYSNCTVTAQNGNWHSSYYSFNPGDGWFMQNLPLEWYFPPMKFPM